MRYTEKHSKGLKSTSYKGVFLEQKVSRDLMRFGTPVLISSKLLRAYACGQVDMAVYNNGKLIVFEIKSKPDLISPKQLARLKRSCTLLASYFNSSVELKVINSLPKC